MLSGCSVILNVIDLRNRKAACKGNDEQTFTFADAYGKIKKHRKRYVSYTKEDRGFPLRQGLFSYTSETSNVHKIPLPGDSTHSR